MPEPARSPRSRPPGAPGACYYLGRPVGWWITALHRQPPGRPAGSGQTFPLERNPR
jgi:hypothetical protein